MMLPLPGIKVASMVSRSPPTSVHARPTTWPIWLLLLRLAEVVLAHAEELVEVVLGDDDLARSYGLQLDDP